MPSKNRDRSKKPQLCFSCLEAHPPGQHLTNPPIKGKLKVEVLLEHRKDLTNQLLDLEAELYMEMTKLLKSSDEDKLCDTEDAAYYLGVSKDWIRQHGAMFKVQLPGTTKQLYSYKAIQDYLKTRRKNL